MIMIEELKKNNLINYRGDTVTVLGINTDDFIQFSYGDDKIYGEHIDSFDPIPLTEEWLIKWGFFKNGEFAYSEIDESKNVNNNIPIFEIDIVGTLFYFRRTGTRLKYVHSTQNLYFALTRGKEIIKNKEL